MRLAHTKGKRRETACKSSFSPVVSGVERVYSILFFYSHLPRPPLTLPPWTYNVQFTQMERSKDTTWTIERETDVKHDHLPFILYFSHFVPELRERDDNQTGSGKVIYMYHGISIYISLYRERERRVLSLTFSHNDYSFTLICFLNQHYFMRIVYCCHCCCDGDGHDDYDGGGCK